MPAIHTVRVACVGDAGVIADLLDGFNRAYDTPTPGPATLSARLKRLLSRNSVLALLAGEPAIGLASAEEECRRRGSELLEINVDGEDADARRFYGRHGYSDRAPGQTERDLYYHRELATRSAK